jgi:MoaA/NifB/PqqE/SkfB family radical SAM enzyme
MCPFSVRPGVNQVIKKKELTFSEIKRIIDEVSGFKPLKPSFSITGGEPFLRNDILEIMKYIEFEGLRYSFITNGSLITKKIADKIVELNPAGIMFSIDGPEDIHDEIRGVNGTFKKAIRALTMIRSLKKNIPITINCVISAINLPYLEDMVYLAKDLCVNLQYQHMMFTEDKIWNKHKKIMKKYFYMDIERPFEPTSDLHNLDMGILARTVKKINRDKDKAGISVSFLPDLTLEEIPRYYTDDAYAHSDKCLYPWIEARIKPYGDVYPCMGIDFCVGNLRESSLKEIFNNDKMRHFRRVLKKERLFPICARCCKI